MFKKLIATAVSLVLCLATLCACRSYDEFYFDELVFLDVWIGHSGEPGKRPFCRRAVDFFGGGVR